jgi:hypothetical protein
MQVKPIIQKIINQLAIDCDKFFDEVADKNEQVMAEEQAFVNNDQDKPIKRAAAL